VVSRPAAIEEPTGWSITKIVRPPAATAASSSVRHNHTTKDPFSANLSDGLARIK